VATQAVRPDEDPAIGAGPQRGFDLAMAQVPAAIRHPKVRPAKATLVWLGSLHAGHALQPAVNGIHCLGDALRRIDAG
jgi:hypothetical protein